MHDKAKTREQLLAELFELRKRISQLEKERVERKRVEEAVKAERKRLFNVLESLPAMICLLTPDYHVTFANRAFRERFGESQGRHCYDYCFGRSEPCDFCEAYKVLETGLPHHWEVTAPDGSVIDAYDFPFTDANGSPLILEMDIDITERKQIEEELRQSRGDLELRVKERTSELQSTIGRLHREMTERRALEAEREEYLRFFNTSNELMAIFDLGAGCIKKLNPNGVRLSGYSQEELVDRPYMDLIHPEDRQKTLDAIKLQLESGVTANFKNRWVSKDASVRWLSWHGVQDPISGLTYATARDITEGLQMEEELRRSEEKYRHIVENAIEGIFQSTPDGHYITVNPAFAAMFGFDSPEQMIRKVHDIGYECYANRMDRLRILEQLNNGDRVIGLEVQGRKRDGERFWCSLNARCLRDSDGNIVSYDGFTTDITNRKRAEEEAHTQKAILEKVFESAPYSMMLLTNEGRVMKINPACADFSGRSGEEVFGLLGGEVFNCLHSFNKFGCGKGVECSNCAVRSGIMHTLQTGERLYDVEANMSIRKGSMDVEVDILISTALIKDKDSDLVLLTIADITERTLAQKALRDSEERFRELAENIRDIFWVRASDKSLYVSPAYEQICGMSCESFYRNPSSFLELVHPDHKDRVRQALLVESGQEAVLSDEFRIIRPDGTVRWLRARSFPVSRQGRIIRRVGIAEDITANKEAEEFLRIEKDIAFGLGSTGSLVEAMNFLLDSCLQLGGLDSGGIYIVEEETGALKLVCHQKLSVSMIESVTVFEANSPQMRLALKGRTGYWQRPFDGMVMADPVEREGILTLLAIPIKYEEEVIAVLYLASYTQPDIPQSVQTALEVIAAHIGRSLSRVKMAEAIKSQSERLQEANAALRVLLKQREEDRCELEESLLKNVKHLVIPYLERLKNSRLADDQKNFVEIMESHLQEITLPFVRRISAPLLGLTPTEIRVADLIRQGKSSKEICDLLRISEWTVTFHRRGIRRKLGLTGKKLNLQTHLRAMQQL